MGRLNLRFLETPRMIFRAAIFALTYLVGISAFGQPNTTTDPLREFQFRAVALDQADWIQWGDRAGTFSNWTDHSNRLIPVYTFGLNLESVKGENSCYRDAERLTQLYGRLPTNTLNPNANYFDQTDIYRLQKEAWKSGKKHVILMVFDGMDWQTTQAATIYKHKSILYTEGRGTGLSFLDYRNAETDFGYCVTSPHDGATKYDVNGQIITEPGGEKVGGYSWDFGGAHPWSRPGDLSYLLGKRKTVPHPYTDSASSATSMNAGVKTYNAAINITPDGRQVTTLAHEMQHEGFAVGVVTSVPISHATAACVYAHNVSRNDYQDLTRDLLGLTSAAHRDKPLNGVDVLIGGGWGITKQDDRTKQGNNFFPGNKYLTESDLHRVNLENGGRYRVSHRTPGKKGRQVLMESATQAANAGDRLLGYFGSVGGHLPYQTADGKFNPTEGVQETDTYTPEDITENPTLADMAEAALSVLQKNENGFYLMVECGDVDWANHNNNIDDAIGSVFSGDEAFRAIVNWVEENSNWDETCLILTADHGHMMTLRDPEVLTGKRKLEDLAVFQRKLAEKKAADEAERILEAVKKTDSKAASEANQKKANEDSAPADAASPSSESSAGTSNGGR